MPSQLYQTEPPLCPVTALAFYQYGSQLLVLAGEGGWLSIYHSSVQDINVTTSTMPALGPGLGPGRHCLGRIRIFAEQAMQGLRVDDSSENGNVLVWGGQSLTLVTQEHITLALAESAETKTAAILVREVIAPDWIYDALLPHAVGGYGALITAHNEVISFEVNDTGAELSLDLVRSPISPSRPMLYSAQLAWVGNKIKQNHSLLVAAGTVFGEIVVWTCQLALSEPGIKILQVFTGHEGSIFDVVMSPEIALGSEKKARLLASCSDDRTIRVWPLFLDAEDSRSQDDLHSLHAITNSVRETGFQNTFEGLAHRNDDPVVAAETAPRQVTRIKNTYLQNNEPAPQSSQNSSTPPIATVMAHASRIWHVRFGQVAPVIASQDQLQHSPIHVYSFGEDASAQEWRLEFDVGIVGQELSAELVHLRTLSLHSGKNIWAAAVYHTAKYAGALIATGGSDGKISLFQGRTGDQTLPEKLSEVVVTSAVPHNPQPPTVPEIEAAPALVVEDDISSADDPKPKKKKVAIKKVREEIFNSYAFLSDDELLSATSLGRLLLGKFQESVHGLSTSSSIDWTELPEIPDTISHCLKDYNVVRSPRGGGGGGMATVPGVEGLAFMGTVTGQLFYYSSASGSAHELSTKLPGKVDEIFFLPHTRDYKMDEPSASSLRLEIIATTLFRDEAVLLDISIDIATGTLLSSRSDRTLRLPKKAPTSPTAMTITAASRCLDYIVLGSRNGQLCLYKPVGSDVDGVALALETQLQTRTKDAILSIVPLPPRADHLPLSSSSFVVTARDGTYRIYSIDPSSSASLNTQITLQHETATPFGPIVRDAWFVDSETPGEPPELVICGFRSTNFVVWNESRQQELATVDCGGTHRTHTYLYSNKAEKTQRVRFAFTRNSELHLFAQNACATSPLKRGGHGREIRAISASASGRYVATGGEDTVVRIWSNSSRQPGEPGVAGERRCLSVLKLHNTGLHNLVWLDDNCLISAAGSEELFIWRITTICDSAYNGLAVLCESSYPDSTSDKVLRIIGLDATLDKASSSKSMFISVGISNSVIRTYRYTVPTESGSIGTWKLVAQGHYTGACPTQVRHLSMGIDSHLVILAAFADGHLTVWRAATQGGGDDYSDYSLVCATRAHQNAVKTLDLLAQTPSRQSHLAIFTGGDDNSIAITTLCQTNDSEAKYFFSKTFRVAGAHAASVNGAIVLESSQVKIDGLDYFSFTAITCSNDQRVKGWKISITDNKDAAKPVRIQLLNNSYSAIADPGDVERITRQDGSNGAIVVGMGMETWSLQ